MRWGIDIFFTVLVYKFTDALGMIKEVRSLISDFIFFY